MAKRKGRRFYQVGNRIRVHGYNSKTGKYGIIGWRNVEKIDDTAIDSGSFRIVEYVFNYIPTNKKGSPSGYRDFEVRVRMPEGLSQDAREYADKVLESLTNQGMVNTSDRSQIEGMDFVKYSKDDTPQWFVMDNMNKKYKYPKGKVWGDESDL